MKKIYNKPTMILVKMETEHFIAASPGKVDQNQIVNGGTGTNVGGTSSEGGSEDNGNGSVADMAKPRLLRIFLYLCTTKELRDGLSHQRKKFELGHRAQPKLTKEATLRIVPNMFLY